MSGDDDESDDFLKTREWNILVWGDSIVPCPSLTVNCVGVDSKTDYIITDMDFELCGRWPNETLDRQRFVTGRLSSAKNGSCPFRKQDEYVACYCQICAISHRTRFLLLGKPGGTPGHTVTTSPTRTIALLSGTGVR
jgi:hypothetical protein